MGFGPSESLTEARDLGLRKLEMKEGNFSGRKRVEAMSTVPVLLLGFSHCPPLRV